MNTIGRNLIKNGNANGKNGLFENFKTVKDGCGESDLTAIGNYPTVDISPGLVLSCRQYEVNSNVTWSYEMMLTGINMQPDDKIREWWFGQRYSTSVNPDDIGKWTRVTAHDLLRPDEIELNKWVKRTITLTIPEQASEGVGEQNYIMFHNNINSPANISFRIKNVKLEYGEAPTDWTPAPEDLDLLPDDGSKIKQLLKDICDIIRVKTNTTALIHHFDIPSMIKSIGMTEPVEMAKPKTIDEMFDMSCDIIREKLNLDIPIRHRDIPSLISAIGLYQNV